MVALVEMKIRPMNQLLLFLIGISLSAACGALEIEYTNLNPFSGEASRGEGLLLTGEIKPGDYRRLVNKIADNPEQYFSAIGIILASRGGDVGEALRIAHLVKGLRAEAFVGKATGPCLSACFLVFSAAARRDATPDTIGLHRPYVDPQYLTTLSP